MASDAFGGSGALSDSWTAAAGLSKTPLTQTNGCAGLATAWTGPAGVYHSSTEDSCQALIKGVGAGGRAAHIAKRICVRASGSVRGYEAFLYDIGADGNVTTVYVYKNGGELTTRTLGASIANTNDITLRITATGTSTVTIRVYVCQGSGTPTQVGADITDSDSPVGSGHPALIWNIENGTPSDSYIDDWTDNAAAGGVSKPIAMHHYAAMHNA